MAGWSGGVDRCVCWDGGRFVNEDCGGGCVCRGSVVVRGSIRGLCGFFSEVLRARGLLRDGSGGRDPHTGGWDLFYHYDCCVVATATAAVATAAVVVGEPSISEVAGWLWGVCAGEGQRVWRRGRTSREGCLNSPGHT